MQPWSGLAASRHKDAEVRNDIMEIDRFLHEVSNAIGNVQRGQAPDSSGNPLGNEGVLTDYFFLPGRAGGQIAIGGAGADDQLTFKGNATSIMPPTGVPLMRLLLPITGATSTSHGFAIEDSTGNLVFDAKANGSLLLEDPTSYSSGNPVMLDIHATTASLGGAILRVRGGASTVFSVSYYGGVLIDMASSNVAFSIDGNGGVGDLTRWSNSGGTLSSIDSTGMFSGPRATLGPPATDVVPLTVSGLSGGTAHVAQFFGAGGAEILRVTNTPTGANGVYATRYSLTPTGGTIGSGFIGTIIAAGGITANRTYTFPDYTGQAVIRIAILNRTGSGNAFGPSTVASAGTVVGSNQVYYISAYSVCTTGAAGDSMQVFINYTDISGVAKSVPIYTINLATAGNFGSSSLTIQANAGVAITATGVAVGAGGSINNTYIRASTL